MIITESNVATFCNSGRIRRQGPDETRDGANCRIRCGIALEEVAKSSDPPGYGPARYYKFAFHPSARSLDHPGLRGTLRSMQFHRVCYQLHIEVSIITCVGAVVTPQWSQQRVCSLVFAAVSGLVSRLASLSDCGFKTETPSSVTPGKVGEEVCCLALPATLDVSLEIRFCTRFSSTELRRDPCRSLCSKPLARPLHPNHVPIRKSPRINMNTPMAIGAALKLRSLSLSTPVFVAALTPMQIKTSPPKTMRGAKPLDSLEHLLALSDSTSAT